MRSVLLLLITSVSSTTHTEPVSVQRFLRQLTTGHCPHSSAICPCCGAPAADHRPAGRAAINQYLLLLGPQQHTHHSGGQMGQTQTDTLLN